MKIYTSHCIILNREIVLRPNQVLYLSCINANKQILVQFKQTIHYICSTTCVSSQIYVKFVNLLP